MPNIDTLMQEWPTEFEEKLNALMIPNPEIDCDLSTYVNIICSKLLLQNVYQHLSFL